MLIKKYMLTILLILALLLTGCEPQPAQDQAAVGDNNAAQEQNDQTQSNSANNNAVEEPVVEETAPEPTPEPTEPSVPAFDPLPAERQPVEIPTADGRALEGFYYPAKVADAPVVVLMHWAGGTMDDWLEIAPWLQNRQDEVSAAPVGAPGLMKQTGLPYLDPSWFPPMPEEVSFAVLIFNFGDFGNSPAGPIPAGWVDDAYSAMEFAAGLEGVDPHQISALGASIGADGSVDACYLMNMNSEVGSCVGALSLSPGNYLTDDFTYTAAADSIDLDGFPVWCLAAEGDGESPGLCRSLTGTHAEFFIYAGSDHGTMLVTPALTPAEPELDLNAMQLFQAWLDAVYGTMIEDAYN